MPDPVCAFDRTKIAAGNRRQHATALSLVVATANSVASQHMNDPVRRGCYHSVQTRRDQLRLSQMWQGDLSLLSLQSSAVEQVLDILMDIVSWEIAEVVSPCLPRSL